MRQSHGGRPPRRRAESRACPCRRRRVRPSPSLGSVGRGAKRPSAAAIKVGPDHEGRHEPVLRQDEAGATAQAKKLGRQADYAAGKSSSDNASQIAAIENMTTGGREGDPDHRRRREGGEPGDREGAEGGRARDRPRHADRSRQSAIDALFATNNFNAGILIGKYARAATKGKKVTIAMLDEHAGSSVGALRHNGFLKGFGIKASDKQIACVGNGGGPTAPRRRRWRTASRRTRTSTSSTRSTSRAPRAPGRR